MRPEPFVVFKECAGFTAVIFLTDLEIAGFADGCGFYHIGRPTVFLIRYFATCSGGFFEVP